MAEEAKSIQSEVVYELGCFRVDPVNRRLLRDGEAVPLTAKAFDLLLLLIESNGRLLGKEEIMQRIWSQSIVEEGSLTNNISTLRKALGETAKPYQFIVTVPGYGYKLVDPVKEVQEIPAVTIIAEQTISTTIIEEEVSLPIEAKPARALKATPEIASIPKKRWARLLLL